MNAYSEVDQKVRLTFFALLWHVPLHRRIVAIRGDRLVRIDAQGRGEGCEEKGRRRFPSTV